MVRYAVANTPYFCLISLNFKLMERGRFELPEAFTSSDFKSDAFDHSATSPDYLPEMCNTKTDK